MENNIEKEFCDERSGHLEEAVKDIKKGLDRITWLIITTLVAVCSNLLMRADACAQMFAALKRNLFG